jgi:hypothetical protein
MESDIGTNLTQTGCESVKRIEVGHNITHWQVAVNNVENHQVPWKCELP